MCTCIYIYKYIYIYIYKPGSPKYVYIHIYICRYVYVYVFIYIYIHIYQPGSPRLDATMWKTNVHSWDHILKTRPPRNAASALSLTGAEDAMSTFMYVHTWMYPLRLQHLSATHTWTYSLRLQHLGALRPLNPKTPYTNPINVQKQKLHSSEHLLNTPPPRLNNGTESQNRLNDCKKHTLKNRIHAFPRTCSADNAATALKNYWMLQNARIQIYPYTYTWNIHIPQNMF